MGNVWQQWQTPADGASSEVDYEDYSVEQLKGLLKGKDLPVSGTKAELIERLEEYDG